MLLSEPVLDNPVVSTPGKRRLHYSFETIFLVIGTSFGLLFSLMTPPFQVADESRHFVRAYQLSETFLANCGLIPRRDSLPRSLVVALQQTERLRTKSAPKSTIDETLSLMSVDLKPEERASYAETSKYTFVSYLPQFIAITLSRVAGLNAVLTMYIARLAALFLWLALTYTAIKIVPLGRQLLFFIALLPMTIFQAGSVSADSLTFGLSFLLVALFLRLAYQSASVRTSDLLLLTVLSMILTVTKFVYVPLIGLYFLIPRRNFQSSAVYAGSFLMTGCLCIAALLLSLDDSIINSPLPAVKSELAMNGSGPVLPTAPVLTPYPELNFWLENPLNIVRTFWETVGRFGSSYVGGFVGVLGWYGASLPHYLYIVSVVMLCLTVFTIRSRYTISPAHKLILGGIVLAVTMAICVALCTDTAENPAPTFQLRGVQGRYFTPFAFLIGLLLTGRFAFIQRYERLIRLSRIPFILFLLLNAYFCLVIRYYF